MRLPGELRTSSPEPSGGPIVKNKTFFFGSILRWTDHSVTSGTSITGVPTEEGQDLLRSIAGDRPQVRALLEHLAPAQFPTGSNTPITVAGQTVNIPLGTLSGSAPNQLDVWQSSIRLDHTLSKTHTLGGRYLFDDRFNLGGQAVPSGLTEQTHSDARPSACSSIAFRRIGLTSCVHLISA